MYWKVEKLPGFGLLKDSKQSSSSSKDSGIGEQLETAVSSSMDSGKVLLEQLEKTSSESEEDSSESEEESLSDSGSITCESSLG